MTQFHYHHEDSMQPQHLPRTIEEADETWYLYGLYRDLDMTRYWRKVLHDEGHKTMIRHLAIYTNEPVEV